LPGKTRLRNDLRVEWDVKPYTLTHAEDTARQDKTRQFCLGLVGGVNKLL